MGRPVETVPALRLSGEIDLANVDDLRDALQDHLAATEGTVTVDCSDLTFIDSSGVSALAAAWKKAGVDQRELRLANVSPPVRRVLELCGLAPVID